MAVYDYSGYGLYDDVSEDRDKVKKLEYGSEEWKRAKDSIDKQYHTVLDEARLGAELEERQARIQLEREKAEKDAELRKLEAEVADKKSKREFKGKILGIGGGILIVAFKLLYDNSSAITDKFTLDAGAKMINGK